MTRTIPSQRQRRTFGYAIMGPILTDMVQRLYTYLHSSDTPRDSVVFFCARGGLVLRRTLELFARRVGLDLNVRCEDFMVSRLAAFRTAFQLNPTAVAELIDVEFAGRTCGQAVRALANVEPDGSPEWNEPFSVVRLIELTKSTVPGRRMQVVNDEQAKLLRRHIDTLRGGTTSIMLCDTGVFGSILRYLQVGVPTVDWHLALLFRANYKQISTPHFKSTVGVVSEFNVYSPWRPATVALLYWQLIEAWLEPAIPSVRYYQEDCIGGVSSDLEIPSWQDRLESPAECMLAGACDYIRELNPESMRLIRSRARVAWSQLRRKIVFPSAEDVALLAAGRRHVDFGIDETVEFTNRLDPVPRSLLDKLLAAKASMWPEGEIRKQFRRTALLFLAGSEFSRLLRAANRERFLSKMSAQA
jgi:hypothetical protein